MEQLKHLTKLTSLDLSKNGLGGSLSADIQQLSALKSLTLANNQITGSIPPELSALSHLDCVLLQRNKLAGLVPPLPFERFTAGCAIQSYNQLPENLFACPLPPGAAACHIGADAGPPTCTNTTAPPATTMVPIFPSYASYATTSAAPATTTTAAPPTPNTTAAPAWVHRCDPGGCNVCAACCRDFIAAGLPCEECFQELCRGQLPTPAPGAPDVSLLSALGISFSAAAGLGVVAAAACICGRRRREPLEKHAQAFLEDGEGATMGRDNFATAPLIDPEEHEDEHAHHGGGARYR